LANKFFQRFKSSCARTFWGSLWPPGHYYSPIPSRKEILQKEEEIFKIERIEGVDLNEQGQLNLLKECFLYYKELPFTEERSEKFRYYYNNAFYSYSDAIFLYSMMRHYKPNLLVEIGSGFSSAMMLDTNEYFLKNNCQFFFIEPYPKRLLSIVKKKDLEQHKILRNCVQEVPLETFSQLENNDILFIDGSHVSKTGSDVNYILFKILPLLCSGCLIHFHDIFYPFEYPKKWVLEGRIWNEIYILRAFLEFNQQFKIVLFNSYLENYCEEWLKTNMPLCLKNRGGSIWLQKI